MRAYVVLQEVLDDTDGKHHLTIGEVEAVSAEQACRRAAEKLSDDDLKDGITLIAVPARNWASGRNTFAAKTERKLIRS